MEHLLQRLFISTIETMITNELTTNEKVIRLSAALHKGRELWECKFTDEYGVIKEHALYFGE